MAACLFAVVVVLLSLLHQHAARAGLVWLSVCSIVYVILEGIFKKKDSFHIRMDLHEKVYGNKALTLESGMKACKNTIPYYMYITLHGRKNQED